MKSPFSTIAGYDDGDIDTNRSANPHLNDLIEQRYSRRQALMGGLSAAGAAVFGGMLLSACGDDDANKPLSISAGEAATTTAGRTVTLTGQT